MSGWANGGEPDPYPVDQMFIADMPVASPTLPPALRPRRGNPNCLECALGETGVCGRHSYDPLRSLGLVPRSMSPDDRVRWMEVR